MPRYFFHVNDGEHFPDLQGTELSGIEEVRNEAIRFAAALLAEKPQKFWQADEWKMRVTDDKDMTLFQLTFLATASPGATSSR